MYFLLPSMLPGYRYRDIAPKVLANIVLIAHAPVNHALNFKSNV